jgi:hypothetical protein
MIETPERGSKKVNFTTILSHLAEVPDLHARFINTLSLLEYRGARKILKSQPSSVLTADLLAHIAEELRHAQVLKKVALKLSKGHLTTYAEDHLLCAQEAQVYIQTVDFAAVEFLGSKDPWLNYLSTTLLLEERAMKIYPAYDELLTKLGFPGVLKAIVREEEAHLQEVLQNLTLQSSFTDANLATLRRIEDQAFSQFAQAIEKSLDASCNSNRSGHNGSYVESDQSSV